MCIGKGARSSRAHLRAASPQHAALRSLASHRAADLLGTAATLTVELRQTGLPLVLSHAGDIERLIALTSRWSRRRSVAPAC